MNITRAKKLLEQSLESGAIIDIECNSKRQADTIRFALYKARTAIRKQLAKALQIPLESVESEYDTLEILIQPIKGNRYRVRLQWEEPFEIKIHNDFNSIADELIQKDGGQDD